MAFKIISNGTKLMAAIAATAKAYGKARVEQHVQAVSSLHHAAKHGNTTPLNAFYQTLTENDQTTFRLYVQTTFKLVPEARCLTIEKGVFIMAGGDAERTALVKLAETSLINPDGKHFKAWFEKNPVEMAKELNDATFVQALKSLLNKAEGKTKVETKVSPELIAPLRNLVDLASARVANQRAA